MATLEVIDSDAALARVIAAARRLEEHEEVDRWELADDIAEAIDERSRPETVSGLHHGNRHHDSGFYAAIDTVNQALRDAQVVSVGRSSVVGAYTTAKAWPAEDRVEGATYWAHYELRGRDYDGRRKRALERLLSRPGVTRVGPKDVRLWKSSTTPADMTPFLDKVERRVRTSIKSAAAPWEGVALGDRVEIARMLRRIANEIEGGDFQ